MISPTSPISTGVSSVTPSTPSAQINCGKAPDDAPHIIGDSVHISLSGQQYQHAESIGFALFAALLSDPDNKKDELSLLVALAISELALQAIARTSPHIQITTENGTTMYALSSGDVPALSSALSSQNTGALFSGGVASMASAMGGMF